MNRVHRKAPVQPTSPDPRHLSHGLEIPTESYSDQPFIVQTDDGAWLCAVTTGPGEEGVEGQHIVTQRSTDCGKTWSAPVPVEPGDKRENSYAVMLKVPAGLPAAALANEGLPAVALAKAGRIYIFYNHNTDNVREVKWYNGKDAYKRVDSLGHFVFKYSDDHGKSWSAKRYDIPFRLFQCDRENIYCGKLCFFWNVGKPFVHDGAAFVSLHKVGQMGEGFFRQSEGALLKSDNILSEPDPEKIRWETLPDGEVGLRTPPGGGPIAEEQSYVVLSDGSFHVNYRSIDGYPVESYSRDGGHTWSTPRYKRYTDGRKMKNPRAANFVWKCRNGKYLYWFHNHGGHFIRDMWGQSSETNGLVKNGNGPYDDRNPVWLSAGIEVDTPAGRAIAWSEPEIALYDHDPFVRISYPDLVEEDGRYFLSETQKDIARVHEIPAAMLDGMWTTLAATLGQEHGGVPVSADKCLINLPVKAGEAVPAVVPLPQVPWIPHFRTRNWHAADYRGTDSGEGAALEVWVTLPTLDPGQALLDNRDAAGCGFCLCTVAEGAVELTLCDGQTENHWTSDSILQASRRHHVVVNVDGGPRIISYIIDGRFCDGGETRQFGWGRFSPYLRHVNAARELRVAPVIDTLRVYTRAMRVFEAVNHYRLESITTIP